MLVLNYICAEVIIQLKMEIDPRSINDQLLAYQASDYNPKRSNYLALAIRRKKFVYFYNSGDGLSLFVYKLVRMNNLDNFRNAKLSYIF